MLRTALTPTSDIRSFSPMRTPDWRWQAAVEHVDGHTHPRKWEDSGIAQAQQFILALSEANNDAKCAVIRQSWPELYAAYEIYTGPAVRRQELDARLLCEPLEAIAVRMNIPATVIATYAETFFDVLGSLNSRDWLLSQAVRVDDFSFPPTESECWRFVALVGGVPVLDLMVADHLGRAQPEYPDRHELAETVRFLVRDFAAHIQTGRAADPEIIEEHRRRYSERARRRGKKIDPKIAFDLKLLLVAAGMPSDRNLDEPLPVSRGVGDLTDKAKADVGVPAEQQPTSTTSASQCSNPTDHKGDMPWTAEQTLDFPEIANELMIRN